MCFPKTLSLVAVLLVLSVNANEASPIAKVIQMISELQAKILAEGAEAQKVYEEFTEFCEHRSKDVGYEVKTGTAEKLDLEATIAKETAKAGALGERINDLAASIAADEGDLKAATSLRSKEHADFKAAETELMDIISMLKRAMGILEREMAKGGAAMLQMKNAGNIIEAISTLVQAASLSAQDGSKLTALIQSSQQAAEEEPGAPAAAVYEGHSSDIINTLENLLEKAEQELADARSKETSAQNNYDMLKQSLEDDIRFANKDMDESKKALAASAEAKATAEGDLKVTLSDLAADTSALADLHKDCLSKAEDFQAATTSRTEELKALAEAKKVLAETTGAADKLTYGLTQTSFIQLNSRQRSVQFEVMRLIRNLATRHDSSSLAQLATRIDATMHSGVSDPFAKVKGLISDMISKLEEEAGADATEKAFCDKELAETREKKADKSAEIEKLTTKIDQMSARKAQLTDEVAALQQGLADLAAAQLEMDKLRGEENTLYTKNKADMEEGLQGVKLALNVLSDYYSTDAAHEAATGAGASIIGLLEVAESDLSKNLAEIVATEEMATNTYTSETKENQIEKVTKEQGVKYKTKESDELGVAIAEASADRSGVEAELEPVMKYLKSLEDRCIATAETYAERKARREAELTGLKEALEILEGQAVLLQKHSDRFLRGNQ